MNVPYSTSVVLPAKNSDRAVRKRPCISSSTPASAGGASSSLRSVPKNVTVLRSLASSVGVLFRAIYLPTVRPAWPLSRRPLAPSPPRVQCAQLQ
jgi:hypothetical protein